MGGVWSSEGVGGRVVGGVWSSEGVGEGSGRCLE